MKEILAGTYWLVGHDDGSRAICRGGKIKRIDNIWVVESPEMGWITLDNDMHTRTMYRKKVISKKDFQDLVFPKITFEESPVEIEIGKSGRVYTYESKPTKEDPKTSQ